MKTGENRSFPGIIYNHRDPAGAIVLSGIPYPILQFTVPVSSFLLLPGIFVPGIPSILFLLSYQNKVPYLYRTTVRRQPPYDEKACLLRASRGEESAFRQLFDQHRDRVYSFALFLTHQPTMAEEITQDVFTKVWLHREDLAGIDYFISWLKTIARNQAYNYLQKSARERIRRRTLIAEHPGADTPADPYLPEHKSLRLLEEAVRQLPRQQQKIWLLHREQGLTYEQIAARLQLSPHTVKNHMKEAIRNIRTYLTNRIDLLVAVAIALFFGE